MTPRRVARRLPACRHDRGDQHYLARRDAFCASRRDRAQAGARVRHSHPVPWWPAPRQILVPALAPQRALHDPWVGPFEATPRGGSHIRIAIGRRVFMPLRQADHRTGDRYDTHSSQAGFHVIIVAYPAHAECGSTPALDRSGCAFAGLFLHEHVAAPGSTRSGSSWRADPATRSRIRLTIGR